MLSLHIHSFNDSHTIDLYIEMITRMLKFNGEYVFVLRRTLRRIMSVKPELFSSIT